MEHLLSGAAGYAFIASTVLFVIERLHRAYHRLRSSSWDTDASGIVARKSRVRRSKRSSFVAPVWLTSFASVAGIFGHNDDPPRPLEEFWGPADMLLIAAGLACTVVLAALLARRYRRGEPCALKTATGAELLVAATCLAGAVIVLVVMVSTSAPI